jgi:hypothetical protein
MLSSSSIIQTNTGAVSGANGDTLTVTLPAGTTAGTSLILFWQAQGPPLGLPAGWVQDLGPLTSGTANLTAMRRSPLTEGESSWAFPGLVGGNIAWWLAEVAGLDPDLPVDVSASNANAVALSNGSTMATGTTGPGAAFDTLVLAAWGTYVTVGTGAPGSWSGYTNGFTEEADFTFTSASTPVGLAVASKLSGGTTGGPYSSTATYAAGTGTGGTGNAFVLAYAAQDSPVGNPVSWLCGFENGSHFGIGASPAIGQQHIGITGTPGTDIIVETASARSAPSLYGCRIVQAAAAKSVQITTAGQLGGSNSIATAVLGWNFRVVSATGTVILAEVLSVGATVLTQVVYNASTSKVGVRYTAAGSITYQSGTTPLNTWAWIDLRIKSGTTSAGVNLMAWRLEESGVVVDQPSPGPGPNQNVPVTVVRWGSATAQTVTQAVDDLVYSFYATAFPLRPHVIQGLTPDPAGTPTVNGTPGNFALVTNNATGAALTAGTLTAARDAIDEGPPPTISTASDGVVQTTTATTDYIQFPMGSFAIGAARSSGGSAPTPA